MKKIILPIFLLLFISCNKNTPLENAKKTCFLEKVTNSDGTFNSSFKYDTQNRITNFTVFNSKLNFDISYQEPNFTKLINTPLLGQIKLLYTTSGNIISAKTDYGDLLFQYEGKLIKQITLESNVTLTFYGYKTTIFRFEYLGENVNKAFVTKGSQLQNFLIFEGIDYDNFNNIYQIDAREYFLIANILTYIINTSEIDFSVISKNNVLTTNIYTPKGTGYFAIQKYKYNYDTNGYPIQKQYTQQSNGTITTYNYSYICK